MLNWNEMIDQMKAVAGELRTGEGVLVELGNLINGWAEQIEDEQLPDTLARAVQAAKAFHPIKTTNG